MKSVFSSKEIKSILESAAIITVIGMGVHYVEEISENVIDETYKILWMTAGMKMATEEYLDSEDVKLALQGATVEIAQKNRE